MEALKNHFKKEGTLPALQCHPFTSKTKYSSIQTETCEYKLGAPEYLLSREQLNENSERISQRTSMGQRVLAFVEYQNGVCIPLLFIALENKIRDNAKEIFEIVMEEKAPNIFLYQIENCVANVSDVSNVTVFGDNVLDLRYVTKK